MRAYAQLSTTRSFGMALGPIPIDRVWEWEDRNGIDDPVVRRHVENVFSAIDAKAMRKASANRPSKSGKGDS